MNDEERFLQTNMQLMDEQNQHNDTRSEKLIWKRRAIAAENEASAMRVLLEDARAIIERDHRFWDVVNKEGQPASRVDIRRFMKRSARMLGLDTD